MSTTIVQNPIKQPCIEDVLSSKAVPMQELERNYGPLLMMVRLLIGVVPNCDKTLEIFPPAFITYNLIVPNCLNLPHLLLGWSAPSNLIGLAVYHASKSSGCAYCTMHTCNFALRRGVQTNVLKGSMDPNSTEMAVVNFANNLSSYPPSLTNEDRLAIEQKLTAANVEWVLLASSMMGYLSTFMSAMGISMEKDAVEEGRDVLESNGWSQGKHKVAAAESYLQKVTESPPKSDGWLSSIGLMKYIPFCLRYDSQHTAKIPKSWVAIEKFMRRSVGHEFPMLGKLKHFRAVRGIAEGIRRNLDSDVCTIDIGWKKLVGILYASVHKNLIMKNGFDEMITKMHSSSEDFIDPVKAFAEEDTDFTVSFEETLEKSVLKTANIPNELSRILFISKAASFAPTKTTAIVVDLTREMDPASTVELINWVALLSFLQKLYIYYYPNYMNEEN